MTRPDVWFSDCEVFAKDVIWVFKNKRSGELKCFHNAPLAVTTFIESNPDMWICGYNFRDYDQYILKGTLLGFDNDAMKKLNDLLIFGELQDVWDFLGKESWDIEVPPIIDLFHDIVPRKSLKEIEGNIGLDVVETGVSFDIDRELTDDELNISVKYCIHDVEATEALYYKRLDYIKTKKKLCTMANLDDAEMMKNTNARVVAEALRAEHCEPLITFGRERYIDVIPSEIQWDKLPEIVKVFVEQIDTYSGWLDEIEPILFDLWGTPTQMGIGGIHACTGEIDHHVMKSGKRKGVVVDRFIAKPSIFEEDDEHIILIQDIGSFYPSMMILFNYLSRGVPFEHRHLFKDFYDMRMEAKKSGDTDTANAAKLVLNTVYGCMKNQYNKLYDPFMATCVCISGQLFIIDLMNRIHERISDFEIIQLNTDGWVLRIKKCDFDTLNEVVEDWKQITGFTVDTDIIKKLCQRDVNNYVMEFANGKIKAKGGTVKNWKGGDFKSNSATIVDTALVEFLIHGVPLETTINDCTDLERFQLILKAGSTYDGCCKKKKDEEKYIKIPGKVHRIYACVDGYTFYKYKDGGNPARFPDTPEKSLEDFSLKSIDNLDRSWYTAIAMKKLKAFLGESEKK